MAAMEKMQSEGSEKAILYLVNGVGYSPILTEEMLLSVMTAEIIQVYSIRLGTAKPYYHESYSMETLKIQL